MKRVPAAVAYFVGGLLPQIAVAATGLRAQHARADRAEQRAAALQAEVDRLAHAARTAQLEKDEFLATLSHELRTPLNAMLGWIQLLRLHIQDPVEQAHALDVLERNARAQVQIVADLLDLSRIVTGKMSVASTMVDLEDIVRETVEMALPGATARRIGIEVTGRGPTCVMGDRQRLQQVFSNILGNAVKFTPAGGRIAVRLTADDATAEVQVTDTGIGISEEVLPRVFERFQQGDSGLTRAFGGLGLGLAIVQTLVTLHRGTVEAASPGPNLGATLTVRLPLAPAGARVAAG
jgi:signal transduction histidine kinase